MTGFEVNLIKDRVPSLRKRRSLFVTMFAYLLMCGVLLVVVTHSAAHRWVESSSNRHEMKLLDKKFLEDRSGAGNMRGYAGHLRSDLEESLKKLEALDGIISGRAPVGRILLGLTHTLPRGVNIIHFDMAGDSKTLVFDLVIPIEQSKELNSRQLIDSWQTDAILMSHIKDLKSLLSQRQRIGGGDVYVHRFTCTLDRRRKA